MGSIIDACQAVTEAKRKCLQTGEFQQVKFRSKKAPIQTLFVCNDMIKDRTGGVLQASIFPITLGKVRLAEPLPANPKDSRIIQENGRWFLYVPHEVVLPLMAITQPYSAIGIDSGVRTFLSFVGDGVTGQIGDRDFSKIARLCAHLDDLMSRLDPKRKDNRVSVLKRHPMRKAADKLHWKIKDLVREAHFKSARFLCDSFQILYLPVFESQRLASKAKRKLRKKSVRAMLTWSHHRFRQRWLWMAKKSGVEVIDMNEAYTSKTVN